MSATNGISSLQQTLGTLNVGETRSKVNTAAATTATAPQQDQARVSLAGGLASQPTGDQDVRLDKVNQLRAAIASGTYQVSSSDVADKLLDSLLNGQ